jgi:hypothetical protein
MLIVIENGMTKFKISMYNTYVNRLHQTKCSMGNSARPELSVSKTQREDAFYFRLQRNQGVMFKFATYGAKQFIGYGVKDPHILTS